MDEKMLCPFCLKENTIKKVEQGDRSYYVCSEHPEPKIPVIYGENYKIPREVISAVGFHEHGKSTYFTALFSSLEDLTRVWPGFYSLPVDEHSLDIVQGNVDKFKEGKLPSKTPANFPIPAIVRFSKMPKFKDRFLIFYDTAGENYARASSLINNANFVKRSQTAIFFLSLPDLEYDTQQMNRLLFVYLQGLAELGGNSREQNLLVVLTKGDLLAHKLEKRTNIWNYLVKGDTKNLNYTMINAQMAEMKNISRSLKAFIHDDIGAKGFVNLSDDNFRSVDYCIISALGAAPQGGQLDTSATPKRIFDPLLWVMNNSTGFSPFLFNVISSFSRPAQTPQTEKTSTLKSKISIPKNPRSYRHIVNFLAGSIILSLIFLLMLDPQMVFISSFLPVFSALSPTTTPPVTTFPVNTDNAKDLGVRSYGDYLAAGRTNTYYFDVNSYDSANHNLIKVFTQTKSGHIVTMTVGFNYVPSSDRFDFIASTSSTSSDAVIQIMQPKSGRYYVTVKGIAGSGDTKVSRTLY